MGSTLKSNQQYINCKFDGDGPLRQVIAEFIAPAALRGYVHVPQLSSVLSEESHIPTTVGEALGSQGTITIKTGQIGKGEPYTGISSLVTGEIAQDVAQYYSESEQIPSIVAAGVKLDKQGKVLGAGGILIQKIGGTDIDEQILIDFEDKVINKLNLSDRISNGETAENLFSYLTGLDYKTLNLESKPIGFRCFCSRERMALTLMSLGQSELESIKEDTGKIEMKCHYCSTVNRFELSDLIKH